MVHLLLGDYIGAGSFREVYKMRFVENYVIKIETGKTFYNVAEWEAWQECPTELARWLAPCIHISDCGTCLIQARVTPVKRRPVKIPNWLDDNKLGNWGKYKGRLVCCDYGHHRLLKNSFRRHKLVNGSKMWVTPVADI